jgi:hypothetical protein
VRAAPRLLWSGLFAAWLALAAILAAPAVMPMRMLADASFAGAGAVCGDHGAEPAEADHHPMVACALCLCCVPLLVVLPTLPAPPMPAVILVASVGPTPPARAPPEADHPAAYPRGPPASI